jgi:hypothetical protein
MDQPLAIACEGIFKKEEVNIHQSTLASSHVCYEFFILVFIVQGCYPAITYYWTGLLILDHSHLVGYLTNSIIAETKALEPLKSWHFRISNFRTY